MRKSVNMDTVGSTNTPPSCNYFSYLDYILTGDLTQGVSYVLEDVTIERCKSNVLFLSFRLARNLSSEGLPTSGSDRLRGK